MIELPVTVAGRIKRLRLKLEAANPTGSSKHRTALGLLDALETAGSLHRGSVVVESSSGNLAVSLATLATQRGYGFVAVVDPHTSRRSIAQIVELGGCVEVVHSADEHGNYLRARLDRVRALVRDKGYVWTNQYASAANAKAHYMHTAPELWRQSSGSCDVVLAAVSTGGTLAGTSRYLREVDSNVCVVAVDIVGSVALGGPSGPRVLTGIGSSRRSQILTASDYDEAIFVTTSGAVSHCRGLAAATGLRVGGSSGAVLAAAARFLLHNEKAEIAVCICPDGGERYADTIYCDSWLDRTGVVVDGAVAHYYEAAGLSVARSGGKRRQALASLRSGFMRSVPKATVLGA